MNKFIVITSINKKTEAIKKYDKNGDWNLIVIGDKKTPNIKLTNGIYLSLRDQKELNFKLISSLPINSYQRINIGYLLALKNGADVIASIDDDNIPLKNWGKNLLINKSLKTKILSSPTKFVDSLFEHKSISNKNFWHRGFPLEHLTKRKYQKKKNKKNYFIEIEAGLWNIEPDVDAICRISNGPFNLKFLNKVNIIDNKCYSPFDTQNVILSKRILPSMCLLIDIGRMCDIWASFISQRILRNLNTNLAFTGPTVNHKRNLHNLKNDLFQETLGIKYSNDLISLLEKIQFKKKSNVLQMYEKITNEMSKLKFINSKMTRFQKTWLDDVSKYF